jgi:O-acetylhomoserine/O-acetylserine sulfhydrylase-like pyridoxal-dependent enzyme
MHLQTKAIHSGQKYDLETGSTITPIHHKPLTAFHWMNLAKFTHAWATLQLISLKPAWPPSTAV